MISHTVSASSRALGRLVHALLNPMGLYAGRLPRPFTLQAHLRDLLHVLGVNVVVDVGAHWGEYGASLRRLGYRGRICSFEPVSESVQRLKHLADADSAWSVWPFALSARSGEMALNVFAGTDLTSVLQPNEYAQERLGAAATRVRRESVVSRRFDELYEDLVRGIQSPVVFLKTDTQGHDLAVLRGAGGALANIRALQMELAVKPLYEGVPSFPEALAEVASSGFELTGIFPVLRDLDGLRVVEFDSIFVRTR